MSREAPHWPLLSGLGRRKIRGSIAESYSSRFDEKIDIIFRHRVSPSVVVDGNANDPGGLIVFGELQRGMMEFIQ
jgi:hypothetical protein